jgi:tetratricopeptide (TPR) repeat protein
MARPAKRVSPDTLGGRIRAARQSLHLSLADVANGRYSTSLISQIERNRVEPSPESLRFLAERLNLPLDDLMVLVQQQRESEAEANRYKENEEKLKQAARLLDSKHIRAALDLLATINVDHAPPSLRWRLYALRGQCHFSQRKFVPAQKDFFQAAALRPERPPADQIHEAIMLHLHLAATCRELGQLDLAADHYSIVLKLMQPETPIHYVAEAHWGMALVSLERADSQRTTPDWEDQAQQLKLDALKHAENARTLYRSIGDQVNEGLLTCEIGLIYQGLGRLDQARACLLEVLEQWTPTVAQLSLEGKNPDEQSRIRQEASLVAAAASYLASIELQEQHYEKALAYVHQAQEAAAKSHKLRRAEAYLIEGQIRETLNPEDPRAEQAFRAAVRELQGTDRIGAQIHAHDLLGRHLLKRGRIKDGERELDLARGLAQMADPWKESPILTMKEI